MTTRTILINTIEKVKVFADKTYSVPFDVDLSYDRYTIDAKSIMGIFSFDLSKQLKLIIHSEDNEDVQKYLESIEQYIIVD